jgi:hypothetical protein
MRAVPDPSRIFGKLGFLVKTGNFLGQGKPDLINDESIYNFPKPY